MFGGRHSKLVKTFKIMVGTKSTRTCPLEHIDSIARDAGGILSIDPREYNRPLSQTYLFGTNKDRERFKRILQGRYASTVTWMFIK